MPREKVLVKPCVRYEEKTKRFGMAKQYRRVKPGYRRIFVKQFRHKWTGKIIRAENYGLKAFCFDVPIRRAG